MYEGNQIPDYDLTPNFAKKLCMMSKSKNGEGARNYFLEMERKAMQVSLPQSYPEALRQLAFEVEQREKLKLQLETAQPKIDFFDDVVDSKDAKPIGDIAKVLNMSIGRNTLFEMLRNSKVLMMNNLPFQNYIDKGWFRVVEQKYQTKYGDTKINFKTLVFQKGLEGIRKLVKVSLDESKQEI